MSDPEKSLLVSMQFVKPDDKVIFFIGEVPTFHVRPEVVNPPKPTTLTASKQPCQTKKKNLKKIKPSVWQPRKHLKKKRKEKQTSGFGKSSPRSMAMKADVLEETVVLLFGPNTSIDVGFVAAKLSGHDWGDGDGDGDGEVE